MPKDQAPQALALYSVTNAAVFTDPLELTYGPQRGKHRLGEVTRVKWQNHLFHNCLLDITGVRASA